MSVYPPELPKKKEIAPVIESGKDYPEGERSEAPIEYYRVICPRCKAQSGFPCFIDQKKRAVSYTVVCIARVLAYEAFKIGSVDERRASPFKGKSWGPE